MRNLKIHFLLHISNLTFLHMKHITYQDKKIAYNSEGKGTPVVFVHGFGADSTVWHDFKSEIAKGGYQVITPDLPGFGESELIENASIETMAEVVHELLVQLNLDKIVFIGHSMGGYIGLAFAEKYGEMLLGLGMFHSHPYADTEEKKEGRLRSINVVQEKGTALFVKQLIPGFFAPKFVKSSSFQVDKLVHRASNYSSEAIINALQAMRQRPDRSEVLKNFKQPVLFIIGKEDTAVPQDASMNQTTLPDTSSIVILEEVGHMGMLEARKKTQQAILEFLNFCIKKPV